MALSDDELMARYAKKPAVPAVTGNPATDQMSTFPTSNEAAKSNIPEDVHAPVVTPEPDQPARQNGSHEAAEPPAPSRQRSAARVGSAGNPADRRRDRREPTRPDIHRTPPHSVEAEQGVIGSMIIDPRLVIPKLRQVITTPEYFYIPAHQTIYQHALDLFELDGSIDLITLTQHLRDVGHLDAVGGPAFVTSLFTFVPTAANYAYYLEILRDKFILRQIILTGTEAVRRAYEEQDEVVELLGEVAQKHESIRKWANVGQDDVQAFAFPDLMAFDPKNDPDSLLGARYASRGSKVLWASGSGFGKSTFAIQASVYWANGEPLFGIKPVRPLKSLILQAENDFGDAAEQLQGVLEGIAYSERSLEPEKFAANVKRNVIIRRVVGKTGLEFCGLLETLVQQDLPDMVWMDPLFAFAGVDLTSAVEASQFLREWLDPIVVRNRICLHCIHHTGKPVRDNKDKQKMSHEEFQYLGFGSSEIQNFFRAVNIILPVAGHDKVFRLILSKRGRRAQARDINGEFATSIYLAHSEEGICWLQVPKPDDEGGDSHGKGGKFEAKITLDDFLSEMSFTDPMATAALRSHVMTEKGISKATFYRLFNQAKKDQRIRVEGDGWVRRQREDSQK